MMPVIWLFYAKYETDAELATRVGIKFTQFVICLIKNIIYNNIEYHMEVVCK